MPHESIRVEITFLSAQSGGRTTAASLDTTSYRPHLRADNGEYLGVALCNGPAGPVVPDTTIGADAILMYPGVDYSSLKPGVEFEILEGAQVVGHGRVVTPDRDLN